MNRPTTAKSAFTLVEISIVLVIVGLLVGGVVVGRSLTHSAQVESVVTEFGKYKNAIATFKDTYSALPGDMPNAVQYWQAQAGGTADGLDPTCAALTTPATGTKTCNGDGDGMIAVNPATDNHEEFRFWQHLSNAGLIDGSFSGVHGPAGITDSQPGVNVPKARFPLGGWGAFTFTAGTGITTNYLLFGGGNTGGPAAAPLLMPEEAYNIDRKLDDGLPQSGKVVTYQEPGPYDTTCINFGGTAYLLTDVSTSCSLEFAF